MDTGVLIRWGSIVPGRENEAMALYDETATYFFRLMEEGRLTAVEPFLFSTSDFEEEQGFFIIKGPVTEMFALLDSEDYKTLVTKANLLLHHVRVNLLTTGEGIGLQLERFNKLRSELLHA